MQFDKICVLGLGYIGLPTASTFATHGVHVIGVDVNQRVVETLQNGEVHIHEPGLRTLVQAAIKSGNLEICDHPEDADAFIIAVPTPFKDASQRSQIASESPLSTSHYPLLTLSSFHSSGQIVGGCQPPLVWRENVRSCIQPAVGCLLLHILVANKPIADIYPQTAPHRHW